jgi:hypothetical protein
MPSSRIGGVLGLAALAVAVVAGVASLVVAASRPPAGFSAARTAAGAMPSRGEGGLSAAPTVVAKSQAVTTRSVEVRYHFDTGLTGLILDDRAQLPLRAATSAGGALSTVERPGGGLAVRFPSPCTHYGASNCPRATLQSAPVESLNPGAGPLRFGAMLRIAPNETSKGANVVQKGYSTTGGSQFKLQVDGSAGEPSCVLVGTDSPHIYLARSSVSVADRQWHAVDCARSGGLLTLSVDGVVRGGVSLPTTLSVSNNQPLCIGGKGNSPNNDQFVGSLDEVYVAVG